MNNFASEKECAHMYMYTDTGSNIQWAFLPAFKFFRLDCDEMRRRLQELINARYPRRKRSKVFPRIRCNQIVAGEVKDGGCVKTSYMFVIFCYSLFLSRNISVCRHIITENFAQKNFRVIHTFRVDPIYLAISTTHRVLIRRDLTLLKIVD